MKEMYLFVLMTSSLLFVSGVLSPGGECSTPRECKILAARARAVAKREENKENGEEQINRQKRSERHRGSPKGVSSIDSAGRAHSRSDKRNGVVASNAKHTARFACAVVVVSGPNGLRFQGEAHVQRFLEYAKGCVVYVSAAPHFRRRAMAIAGPQNVFVRRFEEIIRRGTDGVPLAHQPPQWLARVGHVLRAMRSPRWEDFELVVLTHSDFEPMQPYGAALTEVRQNPSVLFVLGEGFVYSGGAAFHRAFQHAGTWDDVPFQKSPLLFPTPNEIRAMARKRAREEISGFDAGIDVRGGGSSSSTWWHQGMEASGSAVWSPAALCGDFVRSSQLLRHICDPDVGGVEGGGAADEGAATGNCACQGALGPVTRNTEVQDLWWQEIHWVFAFSPSASGGTIVRGLDDPELYRVDPELNAMRPAATVCSSSLAFVGGSGGGGGAAGGAVTQLLSTPTQGNAMIGTHGSDSSRGKLGIGKLALDGRADDPVLRLDSQLVEHYTAVGSGSAVKEDGHRKRMRRNLLRFDNAEEEEGILSPAATPRRRTQLRRELLQGDFLSAMENHFSDHNQRKKTPQEWRNGGKTMQKPGADFPPTKSATIAKTNRWGGGVTRRKSTGGGTIIDPIFGEYTLPSSGSATETSVGGSGGGSRNDESKEFWSQQYVSISSVKRPESNAIDQYIHSRVMPAWANHMQSTCAEPPAVPRGSLPLLFLDFGPHIHVGLFPALVRALGAKRISFVNFQPRRTFAAWTYYDETDDKTGQRHVPCATNFKMSSSSSSAAAGNLGLGVRLLCPIWHGSALFDETPLAAAKWNRLNPYQRCLWLVDELTWRFHRFLREHPRIKAGQVLDVPLDESAPVAKADYRAVETLTAQLRHTARRAMSQQKQGNEEKSATEAVDAGAARPDVPTEAKPDGRQGSDESAANPRGKSRLNKQQSESGYKIRYDDVGDVQVREEMLARFRKAQQWGLKAWDDEYFKILDFPQHVLRVIAPERSSDRAMAPRGTKVSPGGTTRGKRRGRMVVKRPPPRRPNSNNEDEKHEVPSESAASSRPPQRQARKGSKITTPEPRSEMPLGQQQPQGMHAPSHFIKPLGETNHREVFHDDIEVENTIGSFNAGALTARQLVRWLVCILIVVLCLSDLYCGLYVQQAARSLLRIAGP